MIKHIILYILIISSGELDCNIYSISRKYKFSCLGLSIFFYCFFTSKIL